MKNREEIESQVIALVKDVLRCKQEIGPATNFVKDLKADSLDLMELIVEVEKTFDVEVTDDKLKSIKTIGDVVDYLAQ